MSNNDHTVKIFDLPSMRLMSTITCPVAVNYAALSPDGNYLACVGDSGATHLYRAAPTGLAAPSFTVMIFLLYGKPQFRLCCVPGHLIHSVLEPFVRSSGMIHISCLWAST